MPTPQITEVDKRWVESSLSRLGGFFGFWQIKSRGFYRPGHWELPDYGTEGLKAFQPLLSELADIIDLDLNKVEIRVFDDVDSLEWHHHLLDKGIYTRASGIFFKKHEESNRSFAIQIARSNFQEEELLLTVLVHEMVHAKILGEGWQSYADEDLEAFTDLAVAFFGFGIFLANAALKWDKKGIRGSGYLPSEIIAYALAHVAWMRGESPPSISLLLGNNTRSEFDICLQYLDQKEDSELTSELVESVDQEYKLFKIQNDAVADRNYGTALESAEKILEMHPKEPTYLNNTGYFKAILGRYEEAIVDLNRAIFFDPEFGYAFNNRGYCYLKLGKLEEAYVDIDSGLRLIGDNGYGWRNLGLYYQEVGELDKALEAMLHARKSDPEVEYLHYHLGLLYERRGERESAVISMERSAQMREQEAVNWLRVHQEKE